ncbi:MAG: ATP-binding protein [Oscillospiraceae bacterium]|nr:ATP-binding protein [Oscillospiraceae bacterium]
MIKRLFFYTTFIMLIGLISFFAVSLYITHTNNIKFAKDTVMEAARICAGMYSDEVDDYSLVGIGNDIRITIVASDGTVIAESRRQAATVSESYLTRPEIQAAAAGNPDAFIRRSESFGINFIYYALKTDFGNDYVFVRAAMPIANIDTYLYQSLPLLVILLCVVVVLCSVLSHAIINRITRPFESIEANLRLLSRGVYEPGNITGSYEEVNQITQSIDDVSNILQTSLNDLREERNKLDYILNSIGDGLFVVDENMNIALINAAALKFFDAGADVTGKNINYLVYDQTLSGAVAGCVVQEKNSVFELTLGGRIFFAAVKRLPDTTLSMVVMSDVTDVRENAKMREEFFANASHELKTPLTAIKGFNELTAANNKDDKLNKFIDSITRETDRMLTLISDMLKLSELENAKTINPVPVSLAKITGEVLDVLSSTISEKELVIEFAGDAEVMAEQSHVYELVKNIIENSVRYNNNGGSLSILVESDRQGSRLLVTDNGIGISPEEQTRVFERFYRVEKSRSQKNGGTGLGLSIIKHICLLYNWNLTLKSKLGVGTEVIVEF